MKIHGANIPAGKYKGGSSRMTTWTCLPGMQSLPAMKVSRTDGPWFACELLNIGAEVARADACPGQKFSSKPSDHQVQQNAKCRSWDEKMLPCSDEQTMLDDRQPLTHN